MVQDENADDPYEQLEDKTVTGMLEDMVKKLDPREATILRFRFGLKSLPSTLLSSTSRVALWPA